MLKALLIAVAAIVGFYWLGLIAIGEPISAIVAGICAIVGIFVYIIRKDWRD